jgi:hypothetical protein
MPRTGVLPGLALPLGASRESVRAEHTVQVTQTAVFLDGRWIADLAGREGGASLPALRQALEATRPARPTDATRPARPMNATEATDSTGPPQPEEAAGTLAVHCDRQQAFATLGRVLRACSEAGYADLAIVVRREEG